MAPLPPSKGRLGYATPTSTQYKPTTMGICRLWPALSSASSRIDTLPIFALKEGYLKNPALGGLILGIDASIWIERFSRSTYNHRARYSGAPELYNIFKHLAALLATCAFPVFVFDGPERPSVKRGKQVILRDDWMVDDLKSMITSFGFRYHMAPGEAEAELALMNELGIVDAVLTDDSDIFIFGARTVIRDLTYEDNSSIITVYRASAIEANDGLGLDRGGLILVALLCGGDYHKNGLRGCGAATAKGVARYGIGTALLEAAKTLDREDLQVFLFGWRIQLRSLLKDDPLGYIGKRHPALARAVTETFPPLEALAYYINPVVSDFPAFYQLPPPPLPDVRVLARFCELEDLFGGCENILKKFRDFLWPGLVLRELMERAFAYVNDQPPLPSSNLFHMEPMGTSRQESMTRLSISNQALEHIVVHSLCGVRDPDFAKYLAPAGTSHLTTGRRFVYVPSIILHDAHTGLEQRKRRKRGQAPTDASTSNTTTMSTSSQVANSSLVDLTNEL